MRNPLPDLLQALRSRRAVRRWQRAAGAGRAMTHGQLARIAPQARAVGAAANSLTEAADRRLLGPGIGQDGIERPPQCDWAWRAGPWAARMSPATLVGVQGGTPVGAGARLFHDCPLAEITVRQTSVTTAGVPAPFVLSLDALAFEGSFLSLAIDLPTEAVASLTRSHIVCVTTRMHMERRAEVFVRLNLSHGPNTDQMVSEVTPGSDGPVVSEFDLGFETFNPARLKAAWIDLIFDTPAMNRVVLEDVTVTRRPRAAL
ncbi:hypothetical protein JANAI62_30470 [Jannaschia pagri]|uniref:Uncharacterized protein n=1 Tax=Jannaschia pagri TaxID=2829797 RepID=A0ABQ4NPT5_9RHOB|nr:MULTISPECIES: DUF6478 family protein [unclassified Jannaschia]GIT92716.1 hypothetical protein JANAI61_31740 [Jannaschia sp. AI_61]GIT96424.1 hypothetical protein JANAI62_30470 [Jannaschia sp. AI_62]